MSMNEMDIQVTTYFDLLAQIKKLEVQAQAIKDTIKGQMIERSTEELAGNGWSATWHNTQTSRFDSRAFKAAHADLYAAFTVKATGTRFTLQPVRA